MDQLLQDKLKSDPYAKMLGMEVIEIGEGSAKVKMTITDQMTNFHGSTNGGVIFSLADVAFAVSSNSHNIVAVGVNMNMSYMAASFPGDTLVAIATEESKNPRLALYRIEVRNEKNNELVALAEGMVYRKKQTIVGE